MLKRFLASSLVSYLLLFASPASSQIIQAGVAGPAFVEMIGSSTVASLFLCAGTYRLNGGDDDYSTFGCYPTFQREGQFIYLGNVAQGDGIYLVHFVDGEEMGMPITTYPDQTFDGEVRTRVMNPESCVVDGVRYGGELHRVDWDLRLENRETPSFSDLTTIIRIGQNTDTDGDGLWDDWEKCGSDPDYNGRDFLAGVDLPIHQGALLRPGHGQGRFSGGRLDDGRRSLTPTYFQHV